MLNIFSSENKITEEKYWKNKMSVKNNETNYNEDEDEEEDEEEEEEGGESNDNKSKQKAGKVIRELPDVDIYEAPNFGDADVEANVQQLQLHLKEKLKGKDLDARFNAYNDLGEGGYTYGGVQNSLHLFLIN